MLACTAYEVAALVLSHLQAQLTATRGGDPDRVFVSPHADPAIEFCASGTAYVAVTEVAPTQGQKCAGMTSQLRLQLGVVRCYPVESDNGAPPAVSVDSAARDVCDDLEAMRRAVKAALSGHEHQVLPWRTRPPRGGVHGSVMDVVVEVGLGAFTEPRSPMLPGDPRG